MMVKKLPPFIVHIAEQLNKCKSNQALDILERYTAKEFSRKKGPLSARASINYRIGIAMILAFDEVLLVPLARLVGTRAHQPWSISKPRPFGSPRAGYGQELIDQQNLSGLSVKQFCLQQTVSVASFYQWHRRPNTPQALIPSPASAPAMFPIRLVRPPRPPSSPVAVQILTPNGYSLRIANACPEQFRTILAVVQASDSGSPSC